MKRLIVGAIICLVLLILPVVGLSAQQPESTESYYVSAKGNDKNDGLSEKKPFKTLTKAINIASRSELKKITVIGTLVEAVSTEDAAPNVDRRENYYDPVSSEILITGKPDAKGNESAILTSKKGPALTVFNLLAIRLENIEISGCNGISDNKSAIEIWGGDLTIAQGTKIIKNKSKYGGGIRILHNGILIMRNNAEISNNEATEDGGGAILVEAEKGKSTIVLLDNATIKDNKAKKGGGVYLVGSDVLMKDNATVSGNKAANLGGGIMTEMDSDNVSRIILSDKVKIENNYAQAGGGIFLNHELILLGTPLITNNNATIAGGGLLINAENANPMIYGEKDVEFEEVMLNARTNIIIKNKASQVPDICVM